jgi:TfoX/Sxy family transcriptional regulator of competence genes
VPATACAAPLRVTASYDWHVAYDEELAIRVRELLDEHAATERHMFGGVAFLIGGNMALAVSGQGGLLVRVAPADVEALLAKDGVEPMQMRGRPMTGWLRVAADQVRTTTQLQRWVGRGTDVAAALPPKRAKRRVR